MTPVETFFDGLEHSAISLWVRGDSFFAFPLIISVHTVGMGFVAGISAAIALRLLGAASDVPLRPLEKFFPVLWLAFAANFGSGVLLFLGYPYKAASNPLFYVKLFCIAAGVYFLLRVRARALRTVLWPGGASEPAAVKFLAWMLLFSWMGAILSGRLLAYTYTWLRVGVPGGF